MLHNPYLQENVRLRDEVSRLRRRIRDLEQALVPGIRLPHEWPLSGQEARIMRALIAHDTLTKAMFVAMPAWYRDRPPTPKSLDKHICVIRRKLAPFGVAIKTQWGVGWRLVDRVAWLQRIGAE